MKRHAPRHGTISRDKARGDAAPNGVWPFARTLVTGLGVGLIGGVVLGVGEPIAVAALEWSELSADRFPFQLLN